MKNRTRNRKRLTMYETIFYRLYVAYRAAKKDGKTYELMPVHEFMGEVYCEEVGKWGFVSYECGARIAEMYRDNPGLLSREWMRGKSGARYYGYRFSKFARTELIKDPTLKSFYAQLRARMAI